MHQTRSQKAKTDTVPYSVPPTTQPPSLSPSIEPKSNAEGLAEHAERLEKFRKLDTTMVQMGPPRLGNGSPIQPKLTIGAPGDKYEQEADLVAKQVVTQIHSPQTLNAPTSAQRQNLPEEDELMMKPMLQRQEGSRDAAPNLEQAINQARGSGQPLDKKIRGSMEQAFGANFGDVRVHTNTQADGMNRALHSRAFTTKQDVFFKRGEYQPDNRGGQELIAHELTHVVQQGGKAVVQRDKISIMGPDSTETPESIWNAYHLATEQRTQWAIDNKRHEATKNSKWPHPKPQGKQPEEPPIPWLAVKDVYVGMTMTGKDSWPELVRQRYKAKGPEQASQFTVFTGTHGNLGGQFLDDEGKIFESYRDEKHTTQDRDKAQELENELGCKVNVRDIFEEDHLRKPDHMRLAVKQETGAGRVVILAWCYSMEAFKAIPTSVNVPEHVSKNLKEKNYAKDEIEHVTKRSKMTIQDIVTDVFGDDLSSYERSNSGVKNYKSFKEFAEKSACYITTACTQARGLKDNCEELQTLRHFRDQYILNLPSGKDLVMFYYDQSPKIVEAIAKTPEPASIYEELYLVIQDCVKAVKEKRNQDAFTTYVHMVLQLRDKYAPNLSVPRSLLEASYTSNQHEIDTQKR